MPTQRKILILFTALVPSCRAGLAGADDLADPEVARAIAEQVWSIFDQIEDLQVQFRSVRRQFGAKQDAAGQWNSGFYAYKRGGYEFLRYEETVGEDSPKLWTYALTPQGMRGWRDDPSNGMRTGAVQQPIVLNFRLQWAAAHYLLVPLFHEKFRYDLSTGQFVVRLPKGSKGNPELILPVRPNNPEVTSGPQEDRPTETTFVLTLSREQGMAPVKMERYDNGQKRAETVLELTEAAPGIWLSEHGTCRQYRDSKGGFAQDYESEFWMEPGSLKINAGLDSEFFQVDFPPGTRVEDRIAQTTYTVGQPGGNLKGAAARAAELVPLKNAGQEPLVVAKSGWSPIDWVLTGFGVIALLALPVAVVVFINQVTAPKTSEARFSSARPSRQGVAVASNPGSEARRTEAEDSRQCRETGRR